MAAYFMNELAFELPDLAFVDRTVHDVDARLPSGDVLGVLVLREPLAVGASLHAGVDEHLRRESTRLGGYTVLERREAALDGAPAVFVSTQWRNGRASFYTREAHLVARPGVRLVLAATAVLGARAACDERFDHLLSTFRLREPD